MNILFSRKSRGSLSAVVFFLCVLVAGQLGGCVGRADKKDNDEAIDTSDVYTLEVVKDRKEKDLHFLRDESSPIPAPDREAFTGLKYFRPDRSWAFECVLQRFDAAKSIVMATSKDRPRDMLHIGFLPFVRDGIEHRLHVYTPRDTSDGHYWFIPFFDKSSGKDTYGGGRFIDIEAPPSDTVFLDFNYAYNPYCAYNSRYDCPIPPAENRLAIAVSAGEKIYKNAH